MKYKGCEFCCCYDCPNNCKICDSCNEGVDGYGYCKTYRELEKGKQLSLILKKGEIRLNEVP